MATYLKGKLKLTKILNMKGRLLLRKILLIIPILLLVLWGCSNSKYPEHYPLLNIEYNGQEFEASVNEVTWAETNIEGQVIGNSLISVPELDIAEDMDDIQIKPNDVLNLKLEYDKNISKIYAIQVDGLGEERKTYPVDIINDSVKAPNKKGEYVYSVKVAWDSTPESDHSVSYVIKRRYINT